jgi:hypothetical protein
MMRFSVLAVAAVACAGVAQGQTGLFGVASFSNFGVQSLYSIDAATGAATVVGSTGLRQISGLDFNPFTGQLIALTQSGDRYAISTTTGASTLDTDSSFGVPEGSIAFESGNAYTTIFDNLHIANAAIWNQVGPSGLPAGADISGLDIGDGLALGLALNGTNPDQLVSFNLITGTASIIGQTGTNSSAVAGLAHSFFSGEWFMSDGSSLFSLNTSTGAATLIGAHGVAGFSGLAFVPAPGSAVLLVAGAATLRRRRR